MKVVFLGATKGIGRALARKMVERGDRLFLLGRDTDELTKSAADLSARDPEQRPVGHAFCDLERRETFESALQVADETLEGFDTVVISGALFGTQERLEAEPEFLARLLDANFSGTILLCEAARKKLLARGGGTLGVFSSVAGDRGRKPVILYGATKAGLSHYLEGLDHRYRAQGLKTVTIKPGFVKTSMTQGLKPPPFAGEPEPVAQRALAAIDAGRPVVYAPAIWRFIMMVIRRLPRFVMRRVGF